MITALEIAVEFQRLTLDPWDTYVEATWQKRQISFRRWREYGDWWENSVAGLSYRYRRYRNKISRPEVVESDAVFEKTKPAIMRRSSRFKKFDVTPYSRRHHMKSRHAVSGGEEGRR